MTVTALLWAVTVALNTLLTAWELMVAGWIPKDSYSVLDQISRRDNKRNEQPTIRVVDLVY